MKSVKLLIVILLSAATFNASAQGILNKIKNKVVQRKDQKVDQAIDKGLDKTEDAMKKSGDPTPTKDSITPSNPINGSGNEVTPVKTVDFKTYANYDFMPGEKILFEDNFLTDADGEFATHWELQKGQAVVNKIGDKAALLITEGNYGWVTPLMKQKKYLGNEWTIEFDHWKKNESYQIILFLQDENHNDKGKIIIGSNEAQVEFLSADGENSKSMDGNYPENMKGDNNYDNKWHHIAIAYKNKQIKVYVDQVRVVVVPNSNLMPDGFALGGIGSPDGPLIFTNMRIAEGGGMNMLGKKFTDTKIVTHGINFDVNKAIIKPESMGTLNGIVQIMKDNPDIKFEVGGHTDSDGDDASNMKLSQSRADAVRNQLINMGIVASRLTAKGYGESKPIAENTTFEGKANNRRVEFVKM